MDSFRLAMCPLDSAIGDADANAKSILDYSGKAAEAGCRVICFPEASLSGYTTTDSLVLSEDDPRVREIVAFSKNIAICFGFFESKDGKKYITQYYCDKGKVVGIYRKAHLGMREVGVFEPGSSLNVIETDIVKTGISICWEAHYPEVSLTYRLRGAELILMPFASPLPHERRIRLWDTIVPARASDNRVFAAACNCDGKSTYCAAPDGSVLEPGVHQGFDVFDLDSSIYYKYRTGKETMSNIDYVSHRRPELYE